MDSTSRSGRLFWIDKGAYAISVKKLPPQVAYVLITSISRTGKNYRPIKENSKSEDCFVGFATPRFYFAVSLLKNSRMQPCILRNTKKERQTDEGVVKLGYRSV